MSTLDRDRVILAAAASALHRLTCVLCPGCGGPGDTERWMADAIVTEITPLIQADGPDQLAAAVAMLRAHDAVVDRLHKRILELAEPTLRKLGASRAANHHARLAAGTEEP